MSAPTANERLLMMSLSKFYEDPAHMPTIIPIIEGQGEVSLRVIDYFVTNYVRRHNTALTTHLANGMETQFNIYLSYRSQLKAYSKQAFDCFRRRDRILFWYARNRSVETTVGQLNFFKWVLTHGVLDYITANLAAIEADMVQRTAKAPCSSGREDEPGPEAACAPEPKPSTNKNMKRLQGVTTISFS